MTYDAWKTREPAEWSFFTCADCHHLFHEDALDETLDLERDICKDCAEGIKKGDDDDA